MPGFTIGRANLQVDGPICDVTIRAPQLMVQALAGVGQPLVAQVPVQAVAMIDTGATATVITPAVAQQLGLQPIGVTLARGAVGHAPVLANVYNVDVVFPGNVTVFNNPVVELPLAGQNIQALIGRDILRHGTLIYIGHLNQVTLVF